MLCFFNDSQNRTAITTIQFYSTHYPRNKTLYSLVVTPHSPHSPAPTGLLPVSVGLCILEILCKWLTYCGAFCIQLSLSCFQGTSMIQLMSIFCFFLWLKNIPLYGCATLSIHHLMGVVTPCITIWGTARFVFQRAALLCIPTLCILSNVEF